MQAKATGASRFWQVAGRAPDPNVDTQRLLPAYAYLPHAFCAAAWSDAEQGDLQKAVLTVAQVHLSNIGHVSYNKLCRTTLALCLERRQAYDLQVRQPRGSHLCIATVLLPTIRCQTQQEPFCVALVMRKLLQHTMFSC